MEAKNRPPRLVAFLNNKIIIKKRNNDDNNRPPRSVAFVLVANMITKHFFPGTFYNDNQRIEVINGK